MLKWMQNRRKANAEAELELYTVLYQLASISHRHHESWSRSFILTKQVEQD